MRKIVKKIIKFVKNYENMRKIMKKIIKFVKKFENAKNYIPL